tara:strand:+ start:752 stop:1084 length:333 start_codon:yes stop_codon:yes gene_type:complete
MSELFTAASNVLKDNTIIDLKNENAFLKRENIKNILIGSKVRVLEHRYHGGQYNQEEVEGIIMSIDEKGSDAMVLLKDGQNLVLRKIYLIFLILEDEKIKKYHDSIIKDI